MLSKQYFLGGGGGGGGVDAGSSDPNPDAKSFLTMAHVGKPG